MVKYSDMDKAIEKLGSNILGAYIHDMSDFIMSQSINKKGMYSVTLRFDGKQLLKDIEKGIPSNDRDFRLRPLLLFLKLKEATADNSCKIQCSQIHKRKIGSH